MYLYCLHCFLPAVRRGAMFYCVSNAHLLWTEKVTEHSRSHLGRIKRLDWCFCHSALLNYASFILEQALYLVTAPSLPLQWSHSPWFLCQFMASHYGHENVGLWLARLSHVSTLELRATLFPLKPYGLSLEGGSSLKGTRGKGGWKLETMPIVQG